MKEQGDFYALGDFGLRETCCHIAPAMLWPSSHLLEPDGTRTSICAAMRSQISPVASRPLATAFGGGLPRQSELETSRKE